MREPQRKQRYQLHGHGYLSMTLTRTPSLDRVFGFFFAYRA